MGLFGGRFLPKLVDYFFIKSSTKAGLIFSGIDVTEAISSQPLIWSRLFPNETYGPGVLLGLLLVILPVVILLFWMWGRVAGGRICYRDWVFLAPCWLFGRWFDRQY